MGIKFSGYKNRKEPFIILGSDMRGEDKSIEIESSLKSLGLSFKPVLGVYMGLNGIQVEEKSFVVNCPRNYTFKTLISLSKHFNQESVLYVDEDRLATLLYNDGKESELNLGRFKPFTEREFNMLHDRLTLNYTFDGSYYYVTIRE